MTNCVCMFGEEETNRLLLEMRGDSLAAEQEWILTFPRMKRASRRYRGIMTMPDTNGVAHLNTPISIAYHEAGHVALVYWRCESLYGRSIVLHDDRFGDSTSVPSCDLSVSDLMVLLGGPVADLLSVGVVRKTAIRFTNEYRSLNSDSTRIRNLLKRLRGKDDKKYQFVVQERVREIIQHPNMWRAIGELATQLVSTRKMDGEECERMMPTPLRPCFRWKGNQQSGVSNGSIAER
jgi:hypothetical protein